MFGIAVCLVVALVCVELVGWIVDKILVFLGKGKPLKRAIERGTLTVEKKKYIEQEAIQQDNAEAIKNSIAGDKVKRRLSREERRQVAISELELRREYLERTHIGWYQLIIIFVIGSFLGLIIEEIWMYITAGVTQSRVGLVWGPFSPLYGFCAVFMTLGLWALKKRYNSPVWLVFVLCFVFGGIIEQITGWSMEVLFGAESWSYLHLPDHITQWVAWRYLFVWGLIGVVWY
ncbi:MAG: putative ABC transporter permease, partial [Coriobacteriales bacterium]